MFVRILERRGFRVLIPGERNSSMLGFRLIRPESRSYQQPGELCLVFQMPPERKNDYRVIVWTTKRMDGWVNHDSGFVLMVDGTGNIVHSSRPTVRSQPGFLLRLLDDAQHARWRVVQRPSHCGRLMDASHRYPTTEDKEENLYWKASFWRCAVHPKDKTHCRGWNDLKEPFPPDVEALIEKEWRQHYKDNQKIRAEGGEPYAALRSRIEHPWKRVPIQTSFEY